MRKWLGLGSCAAVAGVVAVSASASGEPRPWLVKTVAGVAGPTRSSEYSGDGGLALKAGMDAVGVVPDRRGNFYIADYSNNRVRKVNRAGIISTYAGNGTLGYSGDGGPATSASLSNPRSVALD